MTSSDLLHKLIHSLSAAEKRYVKIFLKSDDSKQVSQKLNTLFTALLAQETYSEGELKNIVTDTTLRNNFALYKNLLHEKIMDALAAFDRGNTPEHRIYRRLENHKALWQRGQVKAAAKELDKAQKEALEQENYLLLTDILLKMRTPLLANFHSNTLPLLQQNIVQTEDALEKLQNLFRFNNLYDLAFSIGKLKGQWNISNEKLLRKINADPLLENEKKAQSFEAKLYFHLIHALLQIAQGNTIGELYHRKKITALWKQHPAKIKQLKWRYFASLNNLGMACQRNNYYHEFENLLTELESLSGKGKNSEPLAFRNIALSRMAYYMNTAQFSKISEYKNQLEKEINHYSETLDTGFYLTAYYNISVAEFILSNYNEALKWLKKITDMPRHSVRMDMQRFVPAFRLMLLYSHNSPQLDYDLRNAQRFYAKQPPGTLESLVFKNIKALYLCNSRNEKQTLLSAFLRDMEQLLAQPDNSNIVGIDEVYCWVKALHENKPTLEVATPYLLGKNRSKQEVEKMLREFERGMRKEE